VLASNEVKYKTSDYFILFYFILFYFILFYFILFYFILFYFILFYFILPFVSENLCNCNCEVAVCLKEPGYRGIGSETAAAASLGSAVFQSKGVLFFRNTVSGLVKLVQPCMYLRKKLVRPRNCCISLKLVAMSSMKYVINEDKNKVRNCCQWVYLAISQELGMLKHPVHDSLECGWCIGKVKGQYSELVVAKWSSEGCLWSV